MKNKKQPASQKKYRSANGRPTIGFLTGIRGQFFHHLMWCGIADVARTHNFNAICFTGNYVHDPDGFNAQANILYDLIDTKQLDGLIIWDLMCNLLDPDEALQFYERYRSLPMVVIGRLIEGITGVRSDNYGSMREAIVHLIEVHGRRRIAFIKGLPNFHPHEERYQAYVDVLTEYGLPFDPARVAVPRDTAEMEEPDWGQVALRRLLNEQNADIDALVTNNDRFAHELLPELQVRGIRVPDDIALVSYDDAEGSNCLTPPLTTVPVPLYDFGKQAAEALFAQMESQEALERVKIVSPGLIVRQSCGCLNPNLAHMVARPVVRTGAAQPLEVSPVGQRENIVTEMIRVAKNSGIGLNAGWAEQLLGDFIAALSTTVGEEEAPTRFLSTLDEILRQVMAAEGDTGIWQQALSTMRRQLLPYLRGDETRDRAENLWLQAQMMIGEVRQRVQAYHDLQAEQQKRILSQIGTVLATNFDVNALADILAQELPRLGISRGYVSLYEHPQPYQYPQPAPEWSRLVLAYDEGASVGSQRVELEASGRRFLSRQLVPDGLLPQQEQYNLMVHALYFQNEQIGFMLLDGNQREDDVYEILRAQISSALKGSLLLQEAQQARQAAEKAEEQLIIHQRDLEKLVNDRTYELRLANQYLEKEIAERQQTQLEREHLIQELESKNGELERFAYTISHDLKAPLVTIKGFLGYVQEDTRSGNTKRLQADLQRIGEAVDKMQALLKDLLELSRVGRMKNQPEVIPFDDLLKDAAALVYGRLEERNVKLHFTTKLPVIFGDRQRLLEVVQNLLDNAAKFMGDQNKPRIEVGVNGFENNMPILYVRDNGIGIAPEHHERIFGLFNRLDQTLEGTGVGLALVKRIIEIHGGSIWVESEVGQGTTFFFTLPQNEK